MMKCETGPEYTRNISTWADQFLLQSIPILRIPLLHSPPPQEQSALSCQHVLYSKMICSELYLLMHYHSKRRSKHQHSFLMAFLFPGTYLKIWIILFKTSNCIKIFICYWLKDPQKMQDSWYISDFVPVICIFFCKLIGNIKLTKCKIKNQAEKFKYTKN